MSETESKIEKQKQITYFLLILYKSVGRADLTKNQIGTILHYLESAKKKSAQTIQQELEQAIAPKDSDIKEKRMDYFALCTEKTKERWILFSQFALKMQIVKNYIGQEAMATLKDRFEKTSNDTDVLSLQYDKRMSEITTNVDYDKTQRYFDILSSNKDMKLPFTNVKVYSLHNLVKKIQRKYGINAVTVVMHVEIISASQSSKMRAGMSYEWRTEYVLKNIFNEIQKHKHDKTSQKMEYDFVGQIDQFLVAVCSKRTYKERYKQEITDIQDLNVHAVFHNSLGTDITKTTLREFLKLKQHFVVVSREIYDKKMFLRNNDRVIPSDMFTTETVKNLLNKYCAAQAA